MLRAPFPNDTNGSVTIGEEPNRTTASNIGNLAMRKVHPTVPHYLYSHMWIYLEWKKNAVFFLLEGITSKSN